MYNQRIFIINQLILKKLSINNRLFQILLKDQTFEMNGYKYKFIKLEDGLDHNEYFVYWLPNFFPHSYFLPKMVGDVSKILDERSKFASVAHNDKDYVNFYTEKGHIVENLYIRKQLLDNFLAEIQNLEIDIVNFLGSERVRVECEFSFQEPPYTSHYDEDIRTNLFVKIKKIRGDSGRIYRPNNKHDINDISATLTEYLIDSELSQTLEDSFIRVVEPELKIGEYDIYYSVDWKISSLFGKKVSKRFASPISDSEKPFI